MDSTIMDSVLLAQQPSQALAPYVEKLWYCAGYQAAHSRERVLPSGKFQIIIDLREIFSAKVPLVAGMQSKCNIINTEGLQLMMGVLFRPGGAHAFLKMSADEFRDCVVPLDLVWGSADAGLRDHLREAASPVEKFRILEAALNGRVETKRKLHGAVQYVLNEFHGAPQTQRVLEVIKRTGLSRRRFAQIFREQVGLTPKLYCRILRFQQVVRQIASGQAIDWAEMALTTGHCDQAHLAHEFRAFAGISPGSCTVHEQGWMNHIPIA
jgi:AraC-like DNA-binding protein